MEIERKFLVAEPPLELERYPSQRIAQGYLISAGEDLEVRLRACDGQHLLTVKRGGGLTRDEHETSIEPESFARLWPLTAGHRVEKVRYRIPAAGGRTIELDAYCDALDGLLTADVEFESEAQAQGFTPPDWFGREITGDARYTNQRLADEGLPRPPGAEPPFSIVSGERPGAGLVRLVREQIDLATEQLTGERGDDPEEAVHEARKSFKRVRAALKLVRDELQPEVYGSEIARFRDAGRRLSSARDSQVMLLTLDDICERFTTEVPASRFAALRETLAAEQRLAGAESPESGAAREAVLEDLRVARRGLPGWRLEHDSVNALAGGLERMYRGGLRAMRDATANPSDERLHEVRKRTKDLWYAAEILSNAEPKNMTKLIERAHHLSELIGDDHDLALLAARVSASGDLFADETERARLQTLIARRRSVLQRRARRVGERVYGPRPSRIRSLVEQPARRGRASPLGT